MRLLRIALLVCGAPVLVSGAARAQNDPAGMPAAADIDRYLRRCVPFGFSGQLVIEERGEVLLDAAYGWADRTRDVAVERSSAFGAASMTKPFVAAALLLLQEEGRLDVEAPAGRYVTLPEDKQDLTLHQLLTHTSGLPYSVASDDWEVQAPAELARRLRLAPLESKPGERWEYSGAGYNLLVEVIEAVSGRRYEDFVRERLLVPAGMSRSGFLHGETPLSGPFALSLWRGHDSGDPRAWPLDAVVRGAGDLFTTAQDLRRWNLALRGGSILKPETVATYFEPRVPIQERVDYGYGWFHYVAPDGIRHVEHGGDWKRGYNGVFRRYPEQEIAFFLTCNQRLESGTWMRFCVQDAIDDRLLRDRPIQLPPETLSLPFERLETYAGEYGQDPAERVRIAREVGTLRVEPRGQHAAALLLGLSEDAEATAWDALEGVAAFLDEIAPDPARVLTELLSGATAARDLFLARWTAEIDRIGTPTSFEVLAGIPGPSGTTQFAAELHGPRGTAIALVYWGESFAGLDMDPSFTDLARRFAPETATRFLCHALDTGKDVRAEFDLDANGRPRGLRLPGMDEGVWLERLGE